ncbi:MAG: pyridoxal-phosphate dependent enzyme, partial [Gemmatimonadetes bacterium]|nr:pyridoxal-phosphate dependent enzyme [Gemmatimonadota bacterium]
GNGTAGLEIIEDLPDVDTVIIPYGGGGLSAGITSAIKNVKPDTRVYASEVETAAPFQASLEAGRAVSVERVPTFVDGIGGSSVLEEMWPLTSSLLDGSHAHQIDEVAQTDEAHGLVRSQRPMVERHQQRQHHREQREAQKTDKVRRQEGRRRWPVPIKGGTCWITHEPTPQRHSLDPCRRSPGGELTSAESAAATRSSSTFAIDTDTRRWLHRVHGRHGRPR